ncbi:MAG: hypothetical protein ACE5F1_12070 [Planctomycetota bacterium]
MKHALIASLALLGLAAPSASMPPPQDEEISWFFGPFDEALAKAKDRKTRVFLYVWADNEPCKRLYGETMKDAGCVRALKNLVCVSADSSKKDGAALVERYSVASMPTMLIVAPDGSAEDALVGFCAPKSFVAEMERIKRGAGTIHDLRKRSEKKPEDLALRYRYAEKLRHVGRTADFERVCDSIRRDDPGGKTLTGARICLEDLEKRVIESEDPSKADVQPLARFLKRIKFSDIRHEGWAWVGNFEIEREDKKASRKAYQLAWKSCPPKRRIGFAGELVRVYWTMRDEIRTADKKFILSVGQDAAKRAESMPRGERSGRPFEAWLAGHLDALACCYYMAGRRKQALATVERCKQLDPGNKLWGEREEMITKGQ